MEKGKMKEWKDDPVPSACGSGGCEDYDFEDDDLGEWEGKNVVLFVKDIAYGIKGRIERVLPGWVEFLPLATKTARLYPASSISYIEAQADPKRR